MRHSKIALLGFMGSGKSTVGAVLAGKLGVHFFDLDALLLARTGYASIADIFTSQGEHVFRDLEAEVAQSISESSHGVIATGGGIIGRASNIEALRANQGCCVLLELSFAEVLRRLPTVCNRPLLRDRAFAEKLFVERVPVYQSYADYVIQTENKSVDEICAEILAQLR